MIVISPLKILRPKAKDFVLNLNIYRNMHYKSLNAMKVKYKNLMKEQIELLPVMSKISLTFTLYPSNRRLCDLGNVTSVHEKFFCDALVEFGRLPDDNYTYLDETHSLFGKVDKCNPRVEILIKEK